MLYGTISEYCTKSGCPLMAAGDCRYLWADKKITKPIEVSAPEYVELLMSWVESQLNDESIFPIKFDSSYPKKFHAICATIYKRFFRVYAHIYHAHFKQIQTLGAGQSPRTHDATHTRRAILMRSTHALSLRWGTCETAGAKPVSAEGRNRRRVHRVRARTSVRSSRMHSHSHTRCLVDASVLPKMLISTRASNISCQQPRRQTRRAAGKLMHAACGPFGVRTWTE